MYLFEAISIHEEVIIVVYFLFEVGSNHDRLE